jgi:hypothetical protein
MEHVTTAVQAEIKENTADTRREIKSKHTVFHVNVRFGTVPLDEILRSRLLYGSERNPEKSSSLLRI